ncbi:MAG: hypothetical protein Gaeavirus4_26, partial [Gaeavirus sp.]
MTEIENTLLVNKHILLCISEQLSDVAPQLREELEYIKDNFCGVVIPN